jgi:branched-chain amino acid transport system ATP-binding protein
MTVTQTAWQGGMAAWTPQARWCRRARLPAGHVEGTHGDSPRPGSARIDVHVRTRGDVILDLQNISLSFGGVKALTDISFDVASTRSAPSSARTAPARARCST